MAIALAILRIIRSDIDAIVAFFPCDHYFADEGAFRLTIRSAIGFADEHPTSLKRDSSVRAVRHIIDVVPKLTIEVRREAGREPHVQVHQGHVCRIGTHSTNDLVLADRSVSRFHCKLTCDDSGWRLQDSGSLNGTELNGVRIRDADLRGQGTIVLGDSILHVSGLEPAGEVSVPNISAFGALSGTSVAMR